MHLEWTRFNFIFHKIIIIIKFVDPFKCQRLFLKLNENLPYSKIFLKLPLHHIKLFVMIFILNWQRY